MAAYPGQKILAPYQRGWLLLGSALLVLALLAVIDGRLKAADEPGFVPHEATWILYSAAMPQAWAWFQRDEALAPLKDNYPSHMFDPVLAVRQRSGIRPTPARFQHWLGASLLLHGRGDQWGATLKPGLLTRGALALLGTAAPEVEGLSQYAGLFYGWREGFLVVSPSSSWAGAALAGERYVAPAATARAPVIEATIRASLACTLALECVDGLPISGTLHVTPPHEDRSLSTRYDWRDAPLLYLSASSLASMDFFRGLAQAGLGESLKQPGGVPPVFELLFQAYTDTVAALPDAPAALALQEVGWYDGTPVPELALLLAGSSAPAHPFAPRGSGLTVQPYRWQETEGTMIPLWGDALSLWRSRRAPYWLATTKRARMERLLSNLEEQTPPEPGLAYLALSWPKLGASAAQAVTRFSKAGLLDRWVAPEDVGALTGFFEGAKSMTRAQLRFAGDGAGVQVRGTLLAAAPADHRYHE